MASSAPIVPSTGIKQTIQARHGVATYVPQGCTIKIINTYGKQVVDTWAFALHAPPEDADIDKGEQDVPDKAVDDLKEGTTKDGIEGDRSTQSAAPSVEERASGEESQQKSDQEDTKKHEDNEDEGRGSNDGGMNETKISAGEVKQGEDASVSAEGTADAVTRGGNELEPAQTAGNQVEKQEKPNEIEDKAGQASDTSKKGGWTSYLPSLQRDKTQAKKPGNAPSTIQEDQGQESAGSMTRSWASYLGRSGTTETPKKDGEISNTNSQSKTWSSYLPSGQGFSSYIPKDVNMKGTLSAFAGSHYRDPSKSYAEQLYDFSKTPVGAAGLSVATGSGYAGSLYAAYKAYESTAAGKGTPAMEYLSMTHTRASTLHLSPRVGDSLVSNLRAPLLTVVEDTSEGGHDTLIAACDPQRYRELGVERWEEHGSCAENLVLALKEINEKSGLKGRRAIGADVTVNTVPAPLNLFMNIPWTQEGDISFEEPKTKRGDYVKLRADRDLVVVMSACPQDVLAINGHKPMVAHFVVESSSPEELAEAKRKEGEAKSILSKAKTRMSRDNVPQAQEPRSASTKNADAATSPRAKANDADARKAHRSGKKAPRKLERRSNSSQPATPAPKA